MKRLFVVVLLCVGLLTLTGCSRRSRRHSLARYVPSDSYAVLFVNWTVTRNDARLKKVIKGSEIEKVLAELNINGDSVAELALFSDGLNSQADNSGMLLRGSYSSQEVVDGLMHKGWAERGSEGAKLYTAPANDSCLTVLNSNLIVFGTRT